MEGFFFRILEHKSSPFKLILVQARFDMFHRSFVSFRSDQTGVSQHLQFLVGLEHSQLGHHRVENLVVEFEAEHFHFLFADFLIFKTNTSERL